MNNSFADRIDRENATRAAERRERKRRQDIVLLSMLIAVGVLYWVAGTFYSTWQRECRGRLTQACFAEHHPYVDYWLQTYERVSDKLRVIAR